MKKNLLNVPVKINIWIREECQKEQWEIIKKAKPKILFIQSDWGRTKEECDAIERNRALIDNGIDWECKVYKFYETKNQGLYKMGKKVGAFIWSKVDRCIFLEDDCIPSLSFFKFCEVLLEKYKDDTRVETICGMNHLGFWDCGKSDYFFSRQGSIWGYATWRRVIKERGSFSYFNDPYLMGLLKKRTKNNPIAWKRLKNYPIKSCYENHPPGSEFWFEFDMYSQNRLQIIPKFNLISNHGILKAQHTNINSFSKKTVSRLFFQKTYELDFPLHFTEYVIPDIKYEKYRNKVMNYNQPKIIVLLKHLLCFDIKWFFRKIRNMLSKKENEK